ncbi:MAG: hypothetical protein K6F54_08515 [Lachnospiraceae bacterium]|nr:hypothetical protein [Lachnospiraceae bacterium]
METKEKIDLLTETFRARFDAFTNGCDSLEEIEAWDVEEYGDMDVYYLNEILSIILRLIVVDGKISSREVEYLNKNFGFEYSREELEEICAGTLSELYDSFEERIASDITLMGDVNVKLAEEFKELVELVCNIIAESDENIAEEEREEIRKMKAVIKAC